MLCRPNGECVEVGGSAATVWTALVDAPTDDVSIDALVRILAHRSAASPAEVRPVVQAVLEVLEHHGCVACAA